MYSVYIIQQPNRMGSLFKGESPTAPVGLGLQVSKEHVQHDGSKDDASACGVMVLYSE